MISSEYNNYLPFLASGNNILILSNHRYPQFDSIQESFETLTYRKIDTYFLEELGTTLSLLKINIIILDTTEDPSLSRRYYTAIQRYNPYIIIMTITSSAPTEDEMLLIKESFTTLISPFSAEELSMKLFGALGIFYVIKSISRREIRIKNNAHEEIEKNNFLNEYQGSALFMVDDLSEINASLQSQPLSAELLNALATSLSEISRIFLMSRRLSSVSPIIDDLVSFIKTIDPALRDEKMSKGIGYLGYLIDDISRNLLDLFVDRIIDNVAIFSHSLENNIEYIKSSFGYDELIESEPEFFE
jgi:hypothetical protein